MYATFPSFSSCRDTRDKQGRPIAASGDAVAAAAAAADAVVVVAAAAAEALPAAAWDGLPLRCAQSRCNGGPLSCWEPLGGPQYPRDPAHNGENPAAGGHLPETQLAPAKPRGEAAAAPPAGEAAAAATPAAAAATAAAATTTTAAAAAGKLCKQLCPHLQLQQQ